MTCLGHVPEGVKTTLLFNVSLRIGPKYDPK
jgi:hypothetical protein